VSLESLRVLKRLHKKWRSIPAHIRKGLLRLYIVVTLLWIGWYGSQIVAVLNSHSYGPVWRYVSRLFWMLLLVPIGGPILLFILIWVSEGFRKPQVDVGNLRHADPHPTGSSTDSRDAKSPHDSAEAGKALGRIFFEPDVWHEMNKFGSGDKLAAQELAFARVAIVKDAIRRLQPHSVVIQMSAGVDQYVTGAFAKQEHATTAMIAIQLYEENALPLTELANVVVRRLSYSGVNAVEIARLLEKVAAEAEQLMNVSSALQKLSGPKPR
jgi:hypothetical protein